MYVYQKCPTRYRYDGGGGSRTIQIKIFLSFLPLCASIRNVLFTTGTIEKNEISKDIKASTNARYLRS